MNQASIGFNPLVFCPPSVREDLQQQLMTVIDEMGKASAKVSLASEITDLMACFRSLDWDKVEWGEESTRSSVGGGDAHSAMKSPHTLHPVLTQLLLPYHLCGEWFRSSPELCSPFFPVPALPAGLGNPKSLIFLGPELASSNHQCLTDADKPPCPLYLDGS